jgi:GWxTD domain-containing protein
MKTLWVLVMVASLAAQQADKKKEAALKKELASSYRIWLEQDVAYIMTGEEKRAFLQLGTDDEREQFVEQFWLRRDPTPETAENEYKEEHYRRIAYANDHFASGIPGWRTDRGRIYIRFGPPDEIEAHPSGGTYQRDAAQGGGSSSAYPFEIWRYRHLDGVGQDIKVEFVDPTMSGEYRLTTDPCEKDALTYVPNAGLTQAEQMALSTKKARFQNTDGTHCGAPLGAKPESDNEFSRIETLSKLETAPPVKFRDLENALVTSRVNYNALPMQVRVDYLRVTDESVLANVTVQFENSDLQFVKKDGVEKAVIELLGHVYTLSHRNAATFEKALEIAPGGERAIWQASLPLSPGKYKLEMMAREPVSGNMQRYDVALDVPRFIEGELAASSLILADSISRLPLRSVGGGLFAVGDMKVRPRVSGQFTAEEKLGIYCEVYNAGAGASVSYAVTEKKTGRKTLEFSEEPGSARAVQKLLSLHDFAPGGYTLRVRIEDGGHSVERTGEFSVR